jgi:hypothetical protein
MIVRIKGDFVVTGIKVPNVNFDKHFEFMELEILELQPYRITQFTQKDEEKGK